MRQRHLELGDFVGAGGDCHLYLNHLEQAAEQLARMPGPRPRLIILRRPQGVDGYEYEYEYEDFAVEGYVAQPHIRAPVAV